MLANVDAFLADLEQANRSRHTVRAYASDLRAYTGDFEVVSLRSYFQSLSCLSPATRARKQAALAAYAKWEVRNGYLDTNPLETLERVKTVPPAPRAITRQQFECILGKVKSSRDRLLFRLLFELGLRISEALAIHVEDDLALERDNEHLRVVGKGGSTRTLLIDDPTLVRELRAYLRKNQLARGLLFRAEKNGTGEPLRYQSIQERWAQYCASAGIRCTLHQLRHAHGTELINDGVSLNTIRKRLGHRHMQTTLRYAEQSDQTADAELRARRRRISRSKT